MMGVPLFQVGWEMRRYELESSLCWNWRDVKRSKEDFYMSGWLCKSGC